MRYQPIDRRPNPPRNLPPSAPSAGTYAAIALGGALFTALAYVLGKSSGREEARHAGAEAVLLYTPEVNPDVLTTGTDSFILWIAISQPEARLMVWKPIDRGALNTLKLRAQQGLADISPPMSWCIRSAGDGPPTGYASGQCA